VIIPRDPADRDEKIQQIKDTCLASRGDRDALYLRRKRYFLFGTSDYGVEVKYNRLKSHLDLVSSFLYAPDHCRFSVAASRNADTSAVDQATGLQDEWNDFFKDTGLAYQFSEAILWSLVFDSMFIKIGWNDTRNCLTGTVFAPQDFSVYDESEPDLDSQEAFVHSYSLNWDNAVLRLLRAGMKDQIDSLVARPGNESDEMPPILANLLINSTGGPNIAGAMTGRASVDYEPRATYESKSDNPMVRCHEIVVWDDIAEDYAFFTMMDGVTGCLSDSRETVAAMAEADEANRHRYEGKSNIFLPGEHPFIQVRPYSLYNFFWGESHCDNLIQLQVWTNERLQQISDMLEKQVDPPLVGSGFSGLADEKMNALRGPGAWVLDQIPGAKIDQLSPQMPENLFTEFNEIGHIFLDASGLTETVMGQGEQGVRGEKHAKRLALTGSGRIRKIAVALEPSLVKLADISIKLLQKNSDHRFTTKSGETLVPALVSETNLRISVAGHSHSPLFQDEAKEQAAGLFKAEAIDREMLVRMLDPPNADAIIHALRERVKAEAALKQQQAMSGEQPKPAHARKAA